MKTAVFKNAVDICDKGYEAAELIITAGGMFMTDGEAELSGASLLTGRK